ncbi:DUF6597 domain-containing transcriptional factor [Motilibacter aurantiacus]|uniref:DUF6597 domain-containing transcriptional factor n=1 Tax=Motilibacter aurantiacus TaxID=2714955 RepID=UPI00140BC48A|nr:DUF6597 domain-containing transcriptional factor [Motilibacter aurantiacus]NHC46467.1 hypothetical protein [Motilibacter aurantiacus]
MHERDTAGRPAMSSGPWARTASRKGVLRPDETAAVAGLRRVPDVSEPLAPYVEQYWSVSWDLPAPRAARAEVLSHPCVNLTVETGTARRFGVDLPAALVHGVVTRRFAVDLRGSGGVSAFKFRPGGFAAFSGRLPHRDSVRRLEGVRGLDPARLVREVLAQGTDDGRAAVLDAALAPLARSPTTRTPCSRT